MIDQLKNLLKQGQTLEGNYDRERWTLRVEAFLRSALGDDQAREFLRLKASDPWNLNAVHLGHLQGLIAKLDAAAQNSSLTLQEHAPISVVPHPNTLSNSRKVFLVHGHDDEAKETTARFLEKLGLETIVLHEQPSAGRTIIEKFESYSDDIAFAVILLTPDDVGLAVTSSESGTPRARQNVIMELGYFLGRLGRTKVCALHKGGVELPSDYQGVIYIDMDSAGAWKPKLAQEFVQAKLPINLKALVGG